MSKEGNTHVTPAVLQVDIDTVEKFESLPYGSHYR